MQFGELGKKKATNGEVKTLAEAIVNDHTKTNADIKKLADSKKVQLPTEPGMVAKTRQTLLPSVAFVAGGLSTIRTKGSSPYAAT